MSRMKDPGPGLVSEHSGSNRPLKMNDYVST